MKKLNIRDIFREEEQNAFFSRLYHENYTKLLNFAYNATMRRDIMAAEDIVQNTFCEALKKVDELMEHPNPEGWLWETARNLLRARARKASLRELGLEDCKAEPSFEESRYNMSELKIVVEEILDPEEKELFEKYFLEKHSTREMAKREQMTENAFKVKMHRIRKKIQEQLKG